MSHCPTRCSIRAHPKSDLRVPAELRTITSSSCALAMPDIYRGGKLLSANLGIEVSAEEKQPPQICVTIKELCIRRQM